METWSHLMPLLTWQLWLARDAVHDTPLPWQKAMTYSQLTPARIARGFASLLVRIGSPATEPKNRGKSPGWPNGRKKKPPSLPNGQKTLFQTKK
jgi:hypothetical protein